uniref:protein-serine/threonine phosphatase n=1 Tax=Globodera pallida TaxID=36090 RepID=A0A183CER1_GLOPA
MSLLVGSSSMQGWRISMEDAHTQLLELSEDPTAAFFAVFDGHGETLIAQSNAFNEGRISDSLVEGFLGLDEEMMTNDGIREEMSGSTAVVVLIKDNFIYCANAGDSRAVASVSGRAVALSTGMYKVEFNRVNGNLALSRAFGDFSFKKNESKSAREQIVTACPEVEIQAITPEHEFVLLACDGIWDVMTNQDAITFCRERLISGLVPEKICEELLEKCLAPDCELSGLGCDNMTAILVCLLQNYSLDDYLSQLRATAKPDELQQEAMERYSDAHQSSDSDEAVEDVFSTPSHSPRSSGPKEETNSETKEPNPDQAVENATPPPVERVQSKNSSSQRPQNDRAQQMDI